MRKAPRKFRDRHQFSRSFDIKPELWVYLANEFKRCLLRKILMRHDQTLNCLHKWTGVTLFIYYSNMSYDEAFGPPDHYILKVIFIKTICKQLDLFVAECSKTSNIKRSDRN